MKKLLLLIAIMTFVGSSFAQELKVEVKSKNVVREAWNNPMIKTAITTNDDNPLEDPALDQQRTRGSKECSIEIANNTGYMVEVYVDGVSKGVLDGWSNTTLKAKKGYKTIYAITTGKTKEWFADGDCNGTYTFVLLVGGDK
jgi:hypothetical protein